MKYLEELNNGETFKLDDQLWFLTGDFKSNGQRLCFNMTTGFPKWIDSSSIVDLTPIYYLDKDNNIVSVKIYEKSDKNIR